MALVAPDLTLVAVQDMFLDYVVEVFYGQMNFGPVEQHACIPVPSDVQVSEI